MFRRFQPGDVPYFVNHAHNDYLEWLFEGGLVAAALMLVFLTLYVLRWREIWPSGEERWAPISFVRIAAGIGLLLMGLHGLVDFNLHIPANAVFCLPGGGVLPPGNPGPGRAAAPSAKASAGSRHTPPPKPLSYPNRPHLPPISATPSPTSRPVQPAESGAFTGKRAAYPPAS